MNNNRVFNYTKNIFKAIGVFKFFVYLVVITILNLLIGMQPIVIANLFENNGSISLLYLVILFLTFITNGLINYPQNYMLQNVRKYSKIIIWQDLINRRYQDLIDMDFGEVQNLNSEISFASRSLQYEGFNVVFNIVITMSMYIIILLKFDLSIAITYIMLFVSYFYISVRVSRKNSDLIQNVLDKSSSLNSFFLDFFMNLETVISFNNQDNESEKYYKKVEEERESYFNLQYKIDKSQLILQFLLATITAFLITFMFIKYRYIEPRYGLIFIYTSLNVNGFGKQILSMMESYDRLGIALQKIEYGEMKNKNYCNEIYKKGDSSTLIRLKNIYFSYGNKNIINNFNLDILKGDRILIRGKNGSGKSTLVKIIKGLIYPDDGIVEYYLANSNIGYYSQKMTLFDRSLGENIVYPEENKDVLPYVWLFNTLNFMNRGDIPDVIKKSPGYFGDNLSGGERQKIILIRSIVNSKDVIIFDEIDSALDKTSKNIIQSLFEKNFKDKTLIIISHSETFSEDFFSKIIDL